MKLRVLVAGLVLGLAAFAADSGAELFQKAVTAERAAGNLEEAIKLYQRVAKEFASDRALAAKALVQEARCYEKLGQDKAVKIYEQVARDYRDQREPSATASARLAVLRQGDRPAVPATMTQRKIDAVGHAPGIYRTDGQRMIYRNAANAVRSNGLKP
jgi:tetratricopeptide (TPR) repeat protein